MALSNAENISPVSDNTNNIISKPKQVPVLGASTPASAIQARETSLWALAKVRVEKPGKAWRCRLSVPSRHLLILTHNQW